MDPPTILRIKRKRNEDPLQALILDSQLPKRSKPSSPINSGAVTPDANYYFKLTRTDISNIDDISILLSETSRTTQERNFIIPKPQSKEDEIIPNELSQLVNDFMINHEQAEQQYHQQQSQSQQPPQPPQHQRKKRNHSTVSPIVSNQEDEYVYDVYQLSTTTMTNHNHPKSQIGYIKFFDDSDEEFNNSESDKPIYSDNEDSNAEDFYQNDYPEDEDADIEPDVHNDYKNTDLENDEINNELFDFIQQGDINLVDNYNSEDDEDYVFDDEGEADDEDDDEYEFDEHDFERQKFFDGESDDETAIHRDKIFGKLQRMIEE